MGYVTTSETANSVAVRELIGELRAHCARRSAVAG
ncbi:hypothetical protein J2S55_007080 [Streptosporangium brasiliense]|uniref:Resolvase/invertase-type recombinase catalytic domain-containing protein n=1 Tax=Streptosporangium brasiliense TaxID=47480 RepID=A0ABT9RGH1_9ACTN|nr:hypothetical protein [Streptosporangium brasiliense]